MGDAAKSGMVQSLDAGVGLDEDAFRAPQASSLKNIAAETNLPPSTAHRLLTTLSESGLTMSGSQKWRWGSMLSLLVRAFLAGRDLIETARAPMVRLMEETQETVKIGLLSGQQVVILTQSECSQPMRAFAGHSPALPFTANLGKAFLASRGGRGQNAVACRNL